MRCLEEVAHIANFFKAPFHSLIEVGTEVFNSEK